MPFGKHAYEQHNTFPCPQTPELIELTMPLDEKTDVRETMKLAQNVKDGVELPEDDDSAFEELPIHVEDTEIVVETLIGDETTGSKGLAAECNFKQDDVIVSINGVKVSGA